MNITMYSMQALLPEWLMLGGASLLLLMIAWVRKVSSPLPYLFAQLVLLAAAFVSYCHITQPTIQLFDGQYLFSPLTSFIKVIVCLVSLLCLVFAKRYIETRNLQSGEYYTLILFSVLGMQALISANSLLVFYLGLELMSLPLYALVALERNYGVASEAAIKYFIMGALASGIILYGISMLYGASATLNVDALAKVIAVLSKPHQLIMIFGVIFMVVGLAFKLGLAPFHMWAPDVYHGASNPVTTFIASAPKVATFVFLLRLLVDSGVVLHYQWHELLLVLALLSIVIGNVVAIVQNNIKRMLAYSSIAHMGFIFLGLLSSSQSGYVAALFYMITYVVMALGAFAMLSILSSTGSQIDTLDDLAGLNDRSPWLAFLMLLLMFSMAGVPPTVGFFAKLGIMQSLVDANMTSLAIFAVLLSVVGAYYYLRVVRKMYFEAQPEMPCVCLLWQERVAISISALTVLFLGLFPASLLTICQLLLK